MKLRHATSAAAYARQREVLARKRSDRVMSSTETAGSSMTATRVVVVAMAGGGGCGLGSRCRLAT